MRKIRTLAITGAILVLSSCGEKLEQEVELTWPDGSPQKVLYYDRNKGEREKVREERFYENGNKEMVGGYKGIKKEGAILSQAGVASKEKSIGESLFTFRCEDFCADLRYGACLGSCIQEAALGINNSVPKTFSVFLFCYFEPNTL